MLFPKNILKGLIKKRVTGTETTHSLERKPVIKEPHFISLPASGVFWDRATPAFLTG